MLFQDSGKKFYNKKGSLQLGGKLIQLELPLVMGILNVTPDSFYDGGRYTEISHYATRISEMVEQGAAIIDLGGYSTRPGAADLSVDEEVRRLLPVAQLIKRDFPEIPLSVDTFRSEVVKRLHNEVGDFIVNDISGGTLDSKMFLTVASLGLPYILMHIQGTPATMQNNPTYNNVVRDIVLDLSVKVDRLKLLGVTDIIIDPGFGFGKTVEHNFELLNRLDAFKLFELPILVGLSRKSMIWRTLNVLPDEALNGTTVLNTLALMGGADILRVHDVKEAVESIKLVAKLKGESND